MTDQPAAPSPTPEQPERARTSARAQVSAYAQGSVANMLRSLLVIGVIMGLLVLIFPRVQPQDPDLDVVETAQQVQGATGWEISVPTDLPDGWVPVRAQYRRSTDGLMTWQAGYRTPEGDYASLQETVGATDGWVTQQVNRSPLVGQVDIAGQAWDRYDRSGKVQRSLVRPGGDAEVTTIVTGTAPWDELEAFVASLAPVPPLP